MWQEESQDGGRDGPGPAAGKSGGGQAVTDSRGHGDPSAARRDVSTPPPPGQTPVFRAACGWSTN